MPEANYYFNVCELVTNTLGSQNKVLLKQNLVHLKGNILYFYINARSCL
jgi:hypothetical protein